MDLTNQHSALKRKSEVQMDLTNQHSNKDTTAPVGAEQPKKEKIRIEVESWLKEDERDDWVTKQKIIDC